MSFRPFISPSASSCSISTCGAPARAAALAGRRLVCPVAVIAAVHVAASSPRYCRRVCAGALCIHLLGMEPLRQPTTGNPRVRNRYFLGAAVLCLLLRVAAVDVGPSLARLLVSFCVARLRFLRRRRLPQNQRMPRVDDGGSSCGRSCSASALSLTHYARHCRRWDAALRNKSGSAVAFRALTLASYGRAALLP